MGLRAVMETPSEDLTRADVPHASPSLSLRKLSPVIGVEACGLDLRNPIDSSVGAVLRRAWREHAVLVVRGQSLSRFDQARFGECFGALQMAFGREGNIPGPPAVVYVSNIRKDGKPIGYIPDGELQFHSDQSYAGTPPVGTMLYSIEVPSTGGNTLFACMYAAYDALPAETKARIDGIKALHAYDLSISPTVRNGPVPPDAPSYVHPVVRTDPVTGRKSLFVNRLMTLSIEGMAASESNALLAALFDHQEQPQFIYEHVWQVGDIILWDNRRVIHARTDFSALERRLLRRMVLLHEHPIS